jgi:thiol-disulfide isomerase/thioredoxin
MNAVRVVLLVFFIGISVSFQPGGLRAETRTIATGDKFPNLSFRDILSKGDRAYLGTGEKRTFSIKDMQGNLFVIEIFSTYCMSCPRNVPVLNTVYSTVKNDPKLSQRVRVLAVAIGNTANEAQSYKQEYKVLYPILTDFTFAFHKALGNPRVPFTVIVKRDARGKNIVVYTYPGVIESADSLLNEVQKLLRQEPAMNHPAAELRGILNLPSLEGRGLRGG